MTYLGTIKAGALYLGDVEIAKAYLGTDLVFRKGQPVAPYLEIAPTVAWIYEDLETTNDVYSNTNWNIN